jgi:hypothetical protein
MYTACIGRGRPAKVKGGRKEQCNETARPQIRERRRPDVRQPDNTETWAAPELDPNTESTEDEKAQIKTVGQPDRAVARTPRGSARPVLYAGLGV